MKKAEFVGHLFMYLLGIIMVSFILVFGYKAIVGFKDNTKTFEDVKLKEDLAASVKNAMPYGDVSNKEFKVPGFRMVCFVKTHDGFPSTSSIPYPLIKNSVAKNVQKNVFFVNNDMEDSHYVGEINVSTSTGFLCKNLTGGRLLVRLEGFGDYVKIS